MKKLNIKQITFLTTFIIIIPALFYYSVFSIHDYIVERDANLFQDGWEVGYMQGQIDQDQINQDKCFEISKNKELNFLLKKHFKDCKLAKTMWAIAQAESSGQQLAINKNRNGSLDGGWLQVNSIHKNPNETTKEFIARMHDLEQNVKQAKKVYDKQGLNAWVTYKSGAYLKYMK